MLFIDEAVITQRVMKSKPEFKGVVMIEIDITYPEVSLKGNVSASNRISTFYSLTARRQFNYASNSLYKDAVKEYLDGVKNNFPFRQYSAFSLFNVPYNFRGYLSIYRDEYVYTGGAHGNTTRHAETWETSSGARLSLQDFFKNPSYNQIIFSSIFKQINYQISQGQDIYFDDYQKNVFKYFSEQNFYLTPEGFAIFYPLYTIAPYVAGIVTFIIPYRDFDDNLKRRIL